jgi:hypothetical protein
MAGTKAEMMVRRLADVKVVESVSWSAEKKVGLMDFCLVGQLENK